MNTPRYSQFEALLPGGDVLVAYGPCLSYGLGACEFVLTGYTENLGTAERYNVAADTWTPLGMMMQLPGYLTTYFTPGFTVTQLASGQLLLAGGTSPVGENAATTAQLFNPATNTWKVAAAMNTARADHTATLLQNGKVLVTGGDLAPGYESSGVEYPGVLSSVEIYDPTANTWTPAASLLTARTQHTATLLASGKVLVAGGADANGNSVATAELYDPTSNTWTAAGNLITPRILHTATLLSSGEVLLAGGESLSGGAAIVSGLTATELYNPSTNSWSATAAMASGVERHTATLLNDGTVLVAGGDAGGIYGSTGAAQLYTPSANTWSSLPTMNEYRTGHAATLLSNGQVLVTGGTGLVGVVSQSEIYNPTAKTWTLAAPLNLPRYLHTSIQLSDGRLMIVGGTPGYIPEFWKP
jgi:N-acetylneuraminic acid mutarotase